MTRDIGSNKLCQRKDCLICTSNGSKGCCKTENVTYQIACNRSPCKTNIPKPPLAPPSFQSGPPPVLYRGETSRTGYLRGLGHLRDYRSKSEGSSLWRHSRDSHNKLTGPDRGLQDYTMTKLQSFTKPLDRLSSEGQIIHELETLQSNNKAVCLNSKLDFKQSHSVTLNFTAGSNIPYS